MLERVEGQTDDVRGYEQTPTNTVVAEIAEVRITNASIDVLELMGIASGTISNGYLGVSLDKGTVRSRKRE